MIERKILIGLITSTEYFVQVEEILDTKAFESNMAKILIRWCVEYYNEFHKAPGKDIETLYFQKVREGTIPKDVAEEIEEDILPGLSKEYEQEEQDITYLLQETKKFFQEKHLAQFTNEIDKLIRKGDVTEAEKMVYDFKPVVPASEKALDLTKQEAILSVRKAFVEAGEPLIHYPKVFGEFINDQLVRGGFVAFMGPEKRGKTFLLMDMAIRAFRQGHNVAFFQAGDMTEQQQLRRFGIHLAKKSDMEKYIGVMYEPIPDCLYNQLDTCHKSVRECDFGIFAEKTAKELKEIDIEELKQAYADNPEYRACYNCTEWRNKSIGVPWIKKIEVKNTLEEAEAEMVFGKMFTGKKNKFFLSSHPNDSLTISHMRNLMRLWKRQNNLEIDVIIIDYADILLPDLKQEFRHQQNHLWKGLRSFSQEFNSLVITATQADAASYDAHTLKLKNFSEDKRKFGHVTGFYGLNQDPHGREKNIGLMRINELVLREGGFSASNKVTILQNLRRGLPFMGSYWDLK